MELQEYIVKGGQKLRLGYTTGTCAAAAAKAAAVMLLTGERVSQVRLMTPKGVEVLAEIEDIRFFREQKESGTGEKGASKAEPAGTGCSGPEIGGGQFSAVSCAVRKDSGDDPDITNHALIYAKVVRVKNNADEQFCSAEIHIKRQPQIRIDGGEGVGRVTKPGLDQPVGNAAINSTPRRMIEEAVRDVLDGMRSPASASVGGAEDHFDYEVIISVPQGRELAAKTFNPKLGIEGGISILGTSGIVEPMSDRALLDTIRVEIRVRKEEGLTILPAAPGNYGKNFFLEKYGFSLETSVTASNFIYDTVQMAADAGFTKMLFVGHVGKLVKVAGGIRNTHSQYGDHRMEILTKIAETILSADGKNKAQQDLTEYHDLNDHDFNGRLADFNGKQDGLSDEQAELKKDLKNLNNDQAVEPHPDSRVPNADVERLFSAGSGQRNKELFESLRRELADCVMTDEAIRILREYGLAGQVLSEMTRRIQAVMQEWAQGRMQVEVVVFSNVYGELGRTENALEYMRVLQEQISGVNNPAGI